MSYILTVVIHARSETGRRDFNVLTENKDDHAKNFSFICREGISTIEDMIAVGESIRIPRKKGRI